AAQQSFKISGNLSSNGANATVALSGAVTASTTADNSGNYSFIGLGNGTYTVTPGKNGFTFTPLSQTTTIAGSDVSSFNFTALPTPTSSLAIDAKISRNGPSASASIATPAFSTAAGNELLLAFISADYLGGPNTTVSNVTTAGLTWAPV